MNEGDPWVELRAERALLARVCRVARILVMAEADRRDQVTEWARAALDALLRDGR